MGDGVRHGGLRRRAQARRTVGERLVQQVGNAALDARLHVAGNGDVPAAHDGGIGPRRVETGLGIGVAGTVELLLELLPRLRLRIHDRDDFMSEIAHRAGDAATVMTVGKGDQTHRPQRSTRGAGAANGAHPSQGVRGVRLSYTAAHAHRI